jgi:hypothetical protein
MQSIQLLGLRSGLSLFFSFILLILIQAQPSAVFRVHFDMAEHVLTEVALATIQEKAGILDRPEQFRVQLIGHTDRRGNLDYNQALSERRAASVKAQLIEMGFPVERIRMEGLAFLDPLSDAGTEPAMARNRRVEVIIEAAHWNVESTYYSVPTKEPTEIVYRRSGTKIQIPADAFIYPDGSPVGDEVLVQYREFRDAADFMASRIPMQFDYEGAPAYFNSTGMFEIRAYDADGQALNLQPNKELTLDFVQTQLAEGTEFWRFDEAAQRWEAGNNTVQFENSTTRTVPLGTTREQLGFMYLNWPQKGNYSLPVDTLSSLQTAYEMIPELLASAEEFDHQYIPALDFTSFRDRFRNKYSRKGYAGTHYIGHLDPEEVKTNPVYYNVQLKSGLIRDGQYLHRFGDLSGENPELAVFRDNAWQIRSKDLEQLKGISADANFADVQIRSKKKSMKQFVIQLKYDDRLISLTARLCDKNGVGIDQKTARKQYLQYRRQLRIRQDEFDQAISGNIARARFLWPAIQMLLPREVDNMEDKQTGMSRALHVWTPFSQMVKNKDLDLYFGYNGFVAKYGNLFKSELTAGKNPDWRALIDNYDPEIFVTKERFIEVQTAFDNAVPRLRISGLGVFNCDVLNRFKDEQELLASFTDEQGNPLEFQRIEVIHHSLNGLLSFTTSKIYLDLQAANTLVVYAKDGRIFHLSSNELAKLDLQGKRNFVFQVSDIGDYTGNPEVLRKLFDIG